MKKIIIILILILFLVNPTTISARDFDNDPTPVITNIHPESIRAESSDIISVSGHNFGDRKGSIYLVSKSTQGLLGIDSSDIISWTNEEIKFRLSTYYSNEPKPNDYFIEVDPWADFSTKDAVSTNTLKIYIGQPEIWSSYPDKVDVGDKITILGSNFGWKENIYNYNSLYNDLKLFVGSTQVKSSDIISWWQGSWDSKIEFRVGNYLTSGLISIKGTSITPHIETSGDYLTINSVQNIPIYLDYPTTSTPINLKIIRKTTKSITISWNTVSPSTSLKPAKIFYNIFGSKYDCSFSPTHALTPYNGFVGNVDKPPYTIENLSSNTTYCFKIKAVFLYDPQKGSSSIESDFTPTISTTTLALSEPVPQEQQPLSMSKHPDGTLVYALETRILGTYSPVPIYLIESGYKRPFPSHDILIAHGYKMSEVIDITLEELNSYPLGSSMTMPEKTPTPKIVSKPTEEEEQLIEEIEEFQEESQSEEEQDQQEPAEEVKKEQEDQPKPKKTLLMFLANALTAVKNLFIKFFDLFKREVAI